MQNMIDRLATIKPDVNKIAPIHRQTFTTEEYVKAFINGMGDTQKIRFKRMLQNGIECGLSVAQSYGVNYDEFINEVKKQMEVI